MSKTWKGPLIMLIVTSLVGLVTELLVFDTIAIHQQLKREVRLTAQVRELQAQAQVHAQEFEAAKRYLEEEKERVKNEVRELRHLFEGTQPNLKFLPMPTNPSPPFPTIPSLRQWQ